ncbi:MAG TPA: hypothetical protein VHK47_05360, partial [Polyangia bacterium]|nr:hypothetical protein [Polyangia bacterium]
MRKVMFACLMSTLVACSGTGTDTQVGAQNAIDTTTGSAGAGDTQGVAGNDGNFVAANDGTSVAGGAGTGGAAAAGTTGTG